MPELLVSLRRLTAVLQQIGSGVSIKVSRVRVFEQLAGTAPCVGERLRRFRGAQRVTRSLTQEHDRRIDPVDQIPVE